MKTPEVIKNSLRICSTWETNCEECPYKTMKKAISCSAEMKRDSLTYIEQLEKKVPKWIGVEERMPEHGTDVLVLTAPGTLSFGQNCVVAEYIHPRMEKSGVFINFYAGYDDKNILAVTHWMPLPELPKEDENEAE